MKHAEGVLNEWSVIAHIASRNVCTRYHTSIWIVNIGCVTFGKVHLWQKFIHLNTFCINYLAKTVNNLNKIVSSCKFSYSIAIMIVSQFVALARIAWRLYLFGSMCLADITLSYFLAFLFNISCQFYHGWVPPNYRLDICLYLPVTCLAFSVPMVWSVAVLSIPMSCFSNISWYLTLIPIGLGSFCQRR